jgi:hypothetical protein
VPVLVASPPARTRSARRSPCGSRSDPAAGRPAPARSRLAARPRSSAGPPCAAEEVEHPARVLDQRVEAVQQPARLLVGVDVDRRDLAGVGHGRKRDPQVRRVRASAAAGSTGSAASEARAAAQVVRLRAGASSAASASAIVSIRATRRP